MAARQTLGWLTLPRSVVLCEVVPPSQRVYCMLGDACLRSSENCRYLVASEAIALQLLGHDIQH